MKIEQLKNIGKEKVCFASDYTVLDLETTFFCQEHAIIEIGAVRVRGHKIIDSFQQLVKPAGRIDDFVVKLTGIQETMVADAPSIAEILPTFVSWLGEDLVVGQNVDYDLRCLHHVCLACGMEPVHNEYADTLSLSKALLPELKHHRLSFLCEHLMISQKTIHRALADSEATMQVYEKLRQLWEKSGEDEEELQKRCKCKFSGKTKKKNQLICK